MKQLVDHTSIFCCPACSADIVTQDGLIICKKGCTIEIKEGIPDFANVGSRDPVVNDIETRVNAFYESTPFPDYEGMESINSLVAKAEKGGFANLLDHRIPHNINILEVGCGTGQLSNFLSYGQRNVFGTDLSHNSLQLAESFRQRNNLEHAGFYKMNLFKPCFKEGSFDLVICNGVLHHTGDPRSGFTRIAPLVKKGGYILIGLYNKYGRLTNDVRKVILKMFNGKLVNIDPRVRKAKLTGAKLAAWIRDQYYNPHESRHTIGEVLHWIDAQGFEFVSSMPSATGSGYEGSKNIFTKHARGNALTRLVVQLGLIAKTDNEGGFFIVIAQRKR